jgi:PIN domain nuclease of toxin-antitoxin system
LLLDTHAFLWFLLDEPKLRVTARGLIGDPNNEIHVSPATYWEIAIKIALRKYTLPEPFEAFMEREIVINDFRILPIELKHVAILTTMPFHHRDPFDRLLIAQAIVEQIAIVSGDPVFDAYPITRLW